AIARSMYGQLAAHYADQLQRLDSQQPISVPLDRPFTRLQHAQMDYDGATRYLLPRMTGGELVSMRLIGGPPNHSWAPFSTEDESREIEFAKLERLSVGYYTTYKEKGPIVRHRDGYPWKLHFPSLKSLTIVCPKVICPLLDVDAIVAFIEKLPRIVELVFDSLDPRHMQMDISIPEADDGAIVEPLSTSLSVLAINYARGQYSPDTALAVAKYMLLRIPSLTKLAMT
ncbi:hypothetical protein H4R19_003458, partial [Coemansia spiralis]